MYYVIQKNLFREEGFDKLISCLDRFSLPYELVDVLPFVEEFEYKTERKDVFVFGSLKLARLATKLDWKPGAITTPNHDFEVYSRYYKDNMLNYDSKIVKISDDFTWDRDTYFIRPCLDNKIFSGKVFDEKSWTELKKMIFSEGYVTSATNDTLIQVSSVKNISTEVRFWIVGGKIVTCSTYRRGYFIYYSDIVDNDAIEYVKQMLDIYQLADAFVIDVCQMDNGWKIVECGSISCAGFYKADMQKIIIALEEFYN